jgi:FKBP12-rapamycin complex-associated protein
MFVLMMIPLSTFNKAIMFIFNALGLKSVPFLKNIVPHILATVKNCGQHGLREALLKQVANLSAIVREHLRPYLPAIFDVVEEFWFSRHLSALCSLVERVATAVPDDFRAYVPLLVRQVLASIEAIDLTEWNGSISNSLSSASAERLQLILKHIQGIKGVLGEYIHLVVPALVKLTDTLVNPDPGGKYVKWVAGQVRTKLAIETVETLSILLQTIEINPNILDHTTVKSNSSLPSRVVQPFLRILAVNAVIPNKDVGNAIIGCICICVRQLGVGRWISFYHKECRNAIIAWQTKVGIKSQEGYEPAHVIGSERQLPVDHYDEVVNEISSSGNARWELWSNGNDEDVSGSDLSLGRSGASDVSLSRNDENYKASSAPSIQPIQQYQTTAHKTNLPNLQKAWDVSQRSTREDWDEWMRRFSVQLLRESPSPALRACAELAQAYQPLARELFSAAFVCCWCELNDQYRSNLVFSLEVVFAADASLEILQLLLNLAEFMEHDFVSKDPGLTIDISILADLALKCRAYARALHYKETEYISGRGGSCVEQLIDINKKLDLPDAALGVLRAAKIEVERRGGRSLVSSLNRSNSLNKSPMAYSVITSYGDSSTGDSASWAGDIVYESWLAKLGAWAEAVVMYEQKLQENPHDVPSILGCMQCYDARGEWQKALDLAGRSWAALSGDYPIETNAKTRLSRRSRQKSTAENYKKALKFCSQAAWRLSKWDELESYSSQLVQGHHDSNIYTQSHIADPNPSPKEPRSTNLPELDFDGAFYRAIVHINRAEWDDAANCIDTARMAMDSRFTALLAESYKRAYPSMVAAQELSELEEIISFRQQSRLNNGMQHHTSNRSDAKHARQHLLSVWQRRLDGCRVDAEVHSSIIAVR